MEYVFKFFVDFVIGFLYWVNGLIIAPLTQYVLRSYPIIGTYLSSFYIFINDYILRGATFCRSVICNITGLNPTFLTLLVYFFFTKFAIMIALYGLKGGLNLWGWFRTGKAINGSLKS